MQNEWDRKSFYDFSSSEKNVRRMFIPTDSYLQTPSVISHSFYEGRAHLKSRLTVMTISAYKQRLA